jgi:hypothetical protein
VSRARATTPRDAPPPACCCQGGPLTIATFRDEALHSITRVHWAGRDRCPMPPERVDPATYAPCRRADPDADRSLANAMGRAMMSGQSPRRRPR